MTPRSHQSLLQLVHRTRTDSGLRREADTMGFYVCVTLFVAMAAGSDGAIHRPRDLVLLIWLSTVGLALAHWFADTVSVQLVCDERLHHNAPQLLVSHLLFALIAAASTSLVVLAVPNDVKLLAGRLTAAALLALLVASEARGGGRSPLRSLRLAILVFACAAGIAVLKRLIY